MKNVFIIGLFFTLSSNAQELYVFSEPASNMPAHSISTKLSGQFISGKNFNQRYKPEIMFGISSKWMVHLFSTFSDMHTGSFRFESYGMYAKYRFLSLDDIHEHFRMAVFIDASHTNAPFEFDEISLNGDKSGIEAGFIGTALRKKFALSTTISHTQVLDGSRNDHVSYLPSRNYQSLNYSLSAGLLLIPKEYTDYRQLNLNIYLELLGQKLLERNRSFVDVAPAFQLIFNSNAKLNIGYRMELGGNMERMSNNSWLVSFERTFLGTGKK
jgi:hypothetical protein